MLKSKSHLELTPRQRRRQIIEIISASLATPPKPENAPEEACQNSAKTGKNTPDFSQKALE